MGDATRQDSGLVLRPKALTTCSQACCEEKGESNNPHLKMRVYIQPRFIVAQGGMLVSHVHLKSSVSLLTLVLPSACYTLYMQSAPGEYRL